MIKIQTAIKNLNLSPENKTLDDNTFLRSEYKKLDRSDRLTLAMLVRCSNSKQRSSSAKTKLMSEISGTTAKPWNQKGSGRARQGSRRSVQFVGGRTCHGPSQANFYYSLPKRISRNAVTIAVISKIMKGKLLLIDSDIKNQKCSDFAKILRLNWINSALIISDLPNLTTAARNIKNVAVSSSKSIRPTLSISYEFLLIDKAIFLEKIQPLIESLT